MISKHEAGRHERGWLRWMQKRRVATERHFNYSFLNAHKGIYAEATQGKRVGRRPMSTPLAKMTDRRRQQTIRHTGM